MMNLKKMDVHVKWGGVHLRAGDDYETEYFTEGVHYEATGKSLTCYRKYIFAVRVASFLHRRVEFKYLFCRIQNVSSGLETFEPGIRPI